MASAERAVAALLLLAGAARRYGADKRHVRLPDGEPLALAALRTLRLAGLRVIAVVRPDDAALSALLLDRGAEVTVNARAAAGMGSSLAMGVAAAPEAAGWLVALGDMPALRPETCAGVAAALDSGAEIAAPTFGGRRGHPVGFAARYRAELLALEGDAGARAILARDADRVVTVAVDDPGCLADVDTPADLQALERLRVGA